MTEQRSLSSIFQLNQQTILVVGLVIASFFIGSLYTKNQFLEKNAGKPAQAAAPQQDGQPAAQAPAGKIKEVSNDERIRGNKNAKVTLVEYSDFECPFCQKFHPITLELLKTYGDKIRLVFRDYPLPFHANAQKEAEAGKCIAELGGSDAFWNYADKIFERTTSNGTGFDLTNLGPLAAEVGVNQQAFQECLDTGKYAKAVKDEMADGNLAGVNGTPTTFVIDSKGKTQMLVGAQPVDAFKTVIEQVLK
ncbi:disulfide bond formation protein DsbA [Candidatus Roizmanbacteria bacterium CG_4_10_14_0_8_um_filter_39_9]|uniref:Disulfide bond formation protein DsbA n=1 Tax=Candidatus Roizmanbacteria bacterium CG_4_10_14_0_8_um_filter_39_9 TaxID=1974829 RepID=A0A2M7QD43_9BACT|nr:MAG: disulfide bond formation protein DsbA [Candidatus Roizmanbacteria bacterium CG_4_10_14_0_8_um_filter_39_9]